MQTPASSTTRALKYEPNGWRPAPAQARPRSSPSPAPRGSPCHASCRASAPTAGRICLRTPTFWSALLSSYSNPPVLDCIVTSKRPGMYRYALTPRRLVPPEELKQYESNRIKQLTAVISSTPKLEHAHIQHTQMCLYVVRSVSQVWARCLALFRDTACKCIILAWELYLINRALLEAPY